MLLVAAIGLVINLVGAYVLWRRNRGDGNLKGAFLHVVGDLLGSVGAIHREPCLQSLQERKGQIPTEKIG